MIPLFHVDAFTSTPFRGNPAAVCLPEGELPEAHMQEIAAEMNLSETTFVRPLGGARYALRWFTPTTEVPLCGHATLASAEVLFRERRVGVARVEFETLSGLLAAEDTPEGIRLDFPQNPPHAVAPPADVLAALGVKGVRACLHAPSAGKLLVVLEEAAEVAALAPDFEALLRAGHASPLAFQGVVVTAAGEGDVDYVSRYFGPWVGIPEDPVTGSAHTVLGPYWSGILGKATTRARQVSRRGGDLLVSLAPHGRVHITGRAVVVAQGALRLP